MKGGDEGPSAEVKKEEESTDGAEMKPGKEKRNTVEKSADSKPPGDKYSPKVSPENSQGLLHCVHRYPNLPSTVYFYIASCAATVLFLNMYIKHKVYHCILSLAGVACTAQVRRG